MDGLQIVLSEARAVAVELGTPLTRQPAVLIAPVTTGACFLLQAAALVWAQSAYGAPGLFSGPALLAKAKDASVRVVGAVFALAASVAAAWILLTCDSGLSTDFYGVDIRGEVG
jgi:hypothetical protein